MWQQLWMWEDMNNRNVQNTTVCTQENDFFSIRRRLWVKLGLVLDRTSKAGPRLGFTSLVRRSCISWRHICIITSHQVFAWLSLVEVLFKWSQDYIVGTFIHLLLVRFVYLFLKCKRSRSISSHCGASSGTLPWQWRFSQALKVPCWT